MKKLFILFLCVGGLSFTSVYAQKKKPVKTQPAVQVPENVYTTFKNQFAVAENGQWKKTFRGNYIAEFTNSSRQNQSVEYDTTGRVIKSKIAYSTDAFPSNIGNAVSAQYPGYAIAECVRMEIPGVKPYYRVKLSGENSAQKDLLISEEGTISE
ncbi:MAG: hypothetical protein V9E88_07420 [Ferruginibacter sp.]